MNKQWSETDQTKGARTIQKIVENSNSEKEIQIDITAVINLYFHLYQSIELS